MAYFVDSAGKQVAADRRTLRTTLLLNLPENEGAPSVLSDAYLASKGYHVAQDEQRPAFSHLTHKATLSERATEVDGVWARRWTVEELPAEEQERNREKARAEHIAAIKTLAGAKILERLPDYKQRNYLARTQELRDIKDERAWTPEEAAQNGYFKGEWAWVVEVRTASAHIEATVAKLDDHALAAGAEYSNHVLWPWHVEPEEMP